MNDIALAASECADAPKIELSPDAFHWLWKARYFHSHFSGSVQHSAYWGAGGGGGLLLESRLLCIPRVVEQRGLIPVVSRVRFGFSPRHA